MAGRSSSSTISRRPIGVLQDLSWLDRGGGMVMMLLMVGLRGWNVLHRWRWLRVLALGSLQDSNRVAVAGMRLNGMLLWLVSSRGLGIRDGFLRRRLRLSRRFLLLPHGSLNLLKAHDLPRPSWLSSRLRSRLGNRLGSRRSRGSSMGCGLCWAYAPNATVDIEVGHGLGLPVFFVPCAGRAIARLGRLARIVRSLALILVLVLMLVVLVLLLAGGRPGDRLLSTESDLLFLDGSGYFSRLSKEVKVLSNPSTSSRIGSTTSSKCIIVERIVGIVELVSEAVVGIFELERVIYVSFSPRQSRKGIMGLGEARPCLVVAAGIEAKE